jgi:hypothetical protein
MKRAWLLIFAVVVGAGLMVSRTEFGKALTGRWSFTRSVEVDQGAYFRLKVRLSYKNEPQDFDIVVACNVRQINYKDNSRTLEVGLVPTVFGRRMSDGRGLVVRPPRACGGETTANGRVLPDLLPIVVVYDDANTLDFGTAYLSQDAYEGPSSALVFGGATIENATRKEFDEFRQAQPNLVSRESYYSALGGDVVLKQMGIARVARPWAHTCEGYQRYRIPEEIRPLVRTHWPEGHPNYWQTDDWRVDNDLAHGIVNSKSIRADRDDDPFHRFGAFGPIVPDAADFGLPTRAGGGLVKLGPQAPKVRFPPAYYPAANDFRLDKMPADRSDWPRYLLGREHLADVDIDVRDGAMRGFAYCFVSAFPTNDLILAELAKSKEITGIIDGQRAYSNRAPHLTPPMWLFERDEYVFRFFRIYLESTRGDV